MAQTQLISQLKFRVASLESALSDRQRQLQDLRGVESQADSKIKGLTKIHNDKTKSLLNSIQILKKEKAAVETQSKQHKRSKLIQHLNKQILDQDTVIDVLRKFIYDDKGKSQGRKICDDVIVKALTKGPERIRPVTREELRMEIQKLKVGVAAKSKGNADGMNRAKEFGEASQVSEISEKQFLNQNEQVFKKLRDMQTQNQGLKLEISTKGKIIQKLKGDIKEKDRLKSEVELLANELQVSARRRVEVERLLRQTKENMHKKIGELYERELKVEELEMNSKEDGQRLKQAHQSTNLLVEEMRQQKEQLQVELDMLKKQNEGLMLEKMSMKKRWDEQNSKIHQMREINTNYKEELADKVRILTGQLEKFSLENGRLVEQLREAENKYFKEREEWIQERSKLIEEAAMAGGTDGNGDASMNKSFVGEMQRLRKQNQDLKQLLSSGAGGQSDNKILLQRLESYRLRLEMYQSKGGQGHERQLYDQLFDKYNDLLTEHQKLKKMVPKSQIKSKKLNIVEVTAKEEHDLRDISSGVSQLGLQQIDSDILDNFDSSYQYELRVDQLNRGKMKGLPKMTQEDQELLKLISSDLWDFVKDDRVGAKINEAIQVADSVDAREDEELANRIKEIRKISHPQGKKLVVYDSELKELEGISDSVSVTSAFQKEIENYDSDVNVEVKKTIKGSPALNFRELGRVSDNVSSSSINVSSAKSGESSFVKRKKGEKGEKATVIKMEKDVSMSVASSEMNSSVSSVGVNESALAGMDSDVSMDFRKRKNLKK